MIHATQARLHDMPATVQEPNGTEHWVTRAANFVVVVTRATPGAVLERLAQPDEYMMLLPDEVSATVSAGAERVTSPGDSLTIVPPGVSRVEIHTSGYVYRVFSKHAQDWVAIADNASTYTGNTSEVAPLQPWPDPVGGFRLRHYPLADYIREGSTSRLFRSSNLMVNIFLKSMKPRDTTKMTPHHHDDFEQASLAITGSYVHHLRYPWTPDMSAWREDEHGEFGSPSVIVIPPKVIHTTQSIGAPTRLMDIFAPPRFDFSAKPGLVCNGDEYPMPAPATMAHSMSSAAA